MHSLPLEKGRTAFGGHPELYEAARPPYPGAVYEALREKVTISGAHIFEIGSGTGKASLPLLVHRPAKFTAIEPDRRLAEYLRTMIGDASSMCEIRNEAWEDVRLPADSHDFGFAATAFHWLPQAEALKNVFDVLRPGGWWAMWWNIFGDPHAPDDFHRRSGHLFRGLRNSPSWEPGRTPFGLDVNARVADLRAAGFEEPVVHILRWTCEMNAGQVCDLAATFSEVVNADEAVRAMLLSELARLVMVEFGGRVVRNFVTPLYMARKSEW